MKITIDYEACGGFDNRKPNYELMKERSQEIETTFEKLMKELTYLFNTNNIESFSDTPDYILARVCINALKNYGEAVYERDNWYNFKPWEVLMTNENHN